MQLAGLGQLAEAANSPMLQPRPIFNSPAISSLDFQYIAQPSAPS